MVTKNERQESRTEYGTPGYAEELRERMVSTGKSRRTAAEHGEIEITVFCWRTAVEYGERAEHQGLRKSF